MKKVCSKIRNFRDSDLIKSTETRRGVHGIKSQ